MSSRIKISIVALGFVSIFAAIIQGFLLFLSYGMGGTTMPLFLFGLIGIHFIILLITFILYFPSPTKKFALTVLVLGLFAYVYPLFIAVYEVRPSNDFVEFLLRQGVFGLIPLGIVILQIRSIVLALRPGR